MSESRDNLGREPLLQENPYKPIGDRASPPLLQTYPDMSDAFVPPAQGYQQPPVGAPAYGYAPAQPTAYYPPPQQQPNYYAPPPYYGQQQQYNQYPPPPPAYHAPISSPSNKKLPKKMLSDESHASPTVCTHCGGRDLTDAYSMSCVSFAWCCCLLPTAVLWLIPVCSKSCKNRKTTCGHCKTLVAEKRARCC